MWYALLQPLQLDTLVPADEDDLGSWWLRQRGQLERSSKAVFDSLMLLIAWTLWKERNGRVFQRRTSTVRQIVEAARKDAEDWLIGGYAPTGELIALWSQSNGLM